jgi:CBS domain containing-hemolysin-like protein
MELTGLLIILMLLFSGFFSGMEIAFVSSSRLKHEIDLKRKLLSSRIMSVFYDNPSRFIGALLLGNNIALVVYGIAMAYLLEPVIIQALPDNLTSGFAVLFFQTIISTLVILITAEFLPKVIFRINPNTTLKLFALPVWIFYMLFYPLILLYIGIAEIILKKVLKVKLETISYQFSPIDLEEYVKDYQPVEESRETVKQEIQMIQNVIGFKHVKLRDCMVPRTEIEAVDQDEDVESIRKLFTETGHSKIMIYKESIDNMIGYVHAYDMFKSHNELKKLIRNVDTYPETMPANELLDIFIQKHKSIAVVLDEFGGTSGMVTMEDIIEEIFGEIEDEYDKEEMVEKKLSETEFIFSTRIEIDYLNEKYKFNIPVSDEYETLAGFIIHYYESIPTVNETIEIQPFRFTVLKSSRNRIEEVKMDL